MIWLQALTGFARCSQSDDFGFKCKGGENVITRAEHEEFKKRIEDENHRQNKRIEVLEKITQQINSLTVSVEKLAQSIELMVSEQKQQGKRLETLESRDGDMWRTAVKYVLTTVLGLVLGAVAMKFGLK